MNPKASANWSVSANSVQSVFPSEMNLVIAPVSIAFNLTNNYRNEGKLQWFPFF